jgi:rod shape-determining protein MreB
MRGRSGERNRAALELQNTRTLLPISATVALYSPVAVRLRNLDRRIRDETGLPVSVADDPLCSVVLGTSLSF